MKLKYLLPVATLASVATVVTPLVTSCGGIPTSWDFKKNPEYTAKIKALEGKKMTEQEATQAYYDKLSKTPALYRDDWFAYFSKNLATEEESTINKASVKIKTSGVNLDTQSVPSHEGKSKMISATINYECDLDVKNEHGMTIKYSFTIALNQFKMWIEWGKMGQDDEKAFIFQPVVTKLSQEKQLAFLMSDKSWSITAKGVLDGTKVNISKINAGNLMHHIDDMSVLEEMITPMCCTSHYLSDCTLKEESK